MLTSYFIVSSSIACIAATRLLCFSSPGNAVFRNVSTMLSARLGPTIPAPSARTFALLCSLVSFADTVSAQSAQRMPFTLFAAMEIPIHVVQITIPLSHVPDATAFATACPNAG